MKTPLKPCEHCGGEGALAVVGRETVLIPGPLREPTQVETVRYYAVVCLGCTRETEGSSSLPKEAARRWNDQPYADSLRFQLAEVSAQLQSLRESSIAEFNSRGGIQIDSSELSEEIKTHALVLSRDPHVVAFGIRRAAEHARSSGWCCNCIRHAVPNFSVPFCEGCGNRACTNPTCECGCYCEREGLGKFAPPKPVDTLLVCPHCGFTKEHIEANGGKLTRLHLEDGTVEYCCEGCIPF